MKIRAVNTIIIWDEGAVKVLNPGDTGELGDALALTEIAAGNARALAEFVPPTLTRLDHDGDGRPGGSLPHDPPSLAGRTKAQLLEIAGAEGVAADAAMTNAAIVAAIEARRAEARLDHDGDDDDDDGAPAA